MFSEQPPWAQGAPVQPYGATVFSANGQYGSTVWDPFQGSQKLIVNICDRCLRFGADHHRVVRLHTEETGYVYEEWKPVE